MIVTSEIGLNSPVDKITTSGLLQELWEDFCFEDPQIVSNQVHLSNFISLYTHLNSPHLLPILQSCQEVV
jgi:hypothetical protein